MDKEGKQESSLGTDSGLDREKNKVTDVKTNDQLPEDHSQNETGGNQKPQKQGEKSEAA